MPLTRPDHYVLSFEHAIYAKNMAFRDGELGRLIIYQIPDTGTHRYVVGCPRGASDPAWADWIALYWYDNVGRSGVCI